MSGGLNLVSQNIFEHGSERSASRVYITLQKAFALPQNLLSIRLFTWIQQSCNLRNDRLDILRFCQAVIVKTTLTKLCKSATEIHHRHSSTNQLRQESSARAEEYCAI